mmetsp:Transcript_17798/g.48015  ORF Transcript_17798/g.48015 Transcript_17798/m.48015 type:complete len:153 (-) Transcript_17798:61-519(-)
MCPVKALRSVGIPSTINGGQVVAVCGEHTCAGTAIMGKCVNGTLRVVADHRRTRVALMLDEPAQRLTHCSQLARTVGAQFCTEARGSGIEVDGTIQLSNGVASYRRHAEATLHDHRTPTCRTLCCGYMFVPSTCTISKDGDLSGVDPSCGQA